MLLSWALMSPALAATKGQGGTVVHCTKKELELKSCQLRLKEYHLSFSPDKITVSNGIWKEVHPLPLSGEKVTWERVQLCRLKGRYLVELEIWATPKGEAEVQDLNWAVYELKEVRWQQQVMEVIQKRRLQLDEPKNNKKPQFHFDPKEKYGLKAEGGEKISWFAGKWQGRF